MIMEVKIKTNNELIDAIVEMENGVMIVSPKEEKIKPKDGDILASPNGREFFFFKRDFNGEYADCYGGFGIKTNELFSEGRWNVIRLATEEEKQKLFDKLKEAGYEWDAEKKELVKLKWKPEVGEVYYYPSMKPHNGRVISIPKKEKNTECKFDKEIIDSGWVFKTEEECQAFCDKLNQLIERIKP